MLGCLHQMTVGLLVRVLYCAVGAIGNELSPGGVT